jgi:hypothetical protein
MGAAFHFRRANEESEGKKAEVESSMTHELSPFHRPDAHIETSTRLLNQYLCGRKMIFL